MKKPLKIQALTPKQIASFWSRVDKSGECHIWIGSTDVHGYGRPRIGGQHLLAHRISYFLVKGPLNEEKVLDHLCKNPTCVNPEHLEEVTFAENVKRGNSASAVNARKTHCPRGHEFSAQNTGRVKSKYGHARYCKICEKTRKNGCEKVKARQKIYHAKNKEKIAANRREYYLKNREKFISHARDTRRTKKLLKQAA